jgi:uncharacterized membrane protein YdbT with pleckstrin-like domain
MPVRFRRTFKIFPGVKVNVSKGGISFTVGTKGYHLNFSNRGVKQTVGLPGTGVSHSTYLFDNDEDDDNKEEKNDGNTRRKRTSRKKTDTDDTRETHEEATEEPVVSRRRTPGWVLLLGIVVIYLGALVLGLIPQNFLSESLRALLEWTRSVGL